mgnify:CR=1 FL=1
MFKKDMLNPLQTHWQSQLFNLKIYKYCFCPRGNGIDTHRIWEALYMGCIPVVKKHTTHLFENSNLPILFVEDWDKITQQLLDDTIERFKTMNFNYDKLTLEYWKQLVFSNSNN